MTRQIEIVQPDVLFMIGLYSWHYTLVPLIFSKVPRKIISVRGMLHPGALSQKKWKKKSFLWLFKRFRYPRHIAFHATDNEEKKHIEMNLGVAEGIYVAGNFTDCKGWKALPPKSVGMLKMVSIGIISPMKNIHMVLEALKYLPQQIDYEIAGPVKDEYYWSACQELIRDLPQNITVHYRGAVPPAEVDSLLEAGHIFILPSKSENFGHAIFEALSTGRPVITSHFTPWNHLKICYAGVNVFLDETGELRAAIEMFAKMDRDELEFWNTGARKYAQRRYHPDQLLTAYKYMFENVSEKND